jgi:hypothetical protein
VSSFFRMVEIARATAMRLWAFVAPWTSPLFGTELIMPSYGTTLPFSLTEWQPALGAACPVS